MNQIRMAQPSDAKGIAHVHWTAWMETYTGLIDPGYLAQRSEAKSVRVFESTSCCDMAVAVVDGEIVGFVGYGEADGLPQTGEVRGLYVLQKAQGMGLGRRLMEQALDALRQRGLKKAVLWVLATNRQAIGFYEHLGFAFDGIEKQELLGRLETEKRFAKLL